MIEYEISIIIIIIIIIIIRRRRIDIKFSSRKEK